MVSQADTADVDRAVEAALAASVAWRGLGLPERAARVAELARRLEANLDGFALLDALDTGSLVGPMRAGAGKGATQLARQRRGRHRAAGADDPGLGDRLAPDQA